MVGRGDGEYFSNLLGSSLIGDLFYLSSSLMFLQEIRLIDKPFLGAEVLVKSEICLTLRFVPYPNKLIAYFVMLLGLGSL